MSWHWKQISKAVATALAVGSGGCSGGPPASLDGPTPLQEQMYAHFSEALELRAGAIFGDLERINEAGRRLARETSSTLLPPGSERFMRELRAAATVAASATSDAEARSAAAEAARTCGSCHTSLGVGPDFIVGGPDRGETLLDHMGRQSRISRLLWDGLLGPSDETWVAGATELETEPPFPQEVSELTGDAQLLEESRSQLRDLGVRARQATDLANRSLVLEDVWGVCAGCHAAAGAIGF